MSYVHKRVINGETIEFYDSDDLFDYGEGLNQDKLSTYKWFEHVAQDLFIIQTPKETVGLRLETMQSIPIFTKSMNTLKQWYPNNIIEKPSDIKLKTTLHTTYDFLVRNALIEDKPNERLKELLGPSYETIKTLIRGQVMQDKSIHLTSFTMNQTQRGSQYWENKYSALIGLQAGGVWDIVDFYYDEDGDFCELGHPIKRVVVVREKSTGVHMQYGEHCIEDFLVIKENQLKTLRSYFQKYKDLLVEYWLLAESFAGSSIFGQLQTKQVDLMEYLLKQDMLDLSTKRSVHQNIRTGKREEIDDGLSNTDVMSILQLNKQGVLIPPFLWRYLIDNRNLYHGIEKYFAIKPFNTSIDRALKHYMQVLSYGPYGVNIEDAQTEGKDRFTNYLGQPITKAEMLRRIELFKLTSQELKYKRYIGNDIFDVLAANLNVQPQLNLFTQISYEQQQVKEDPNIKVEYDEDAGSLHITYKGYTKTLTQPLNPLFVDLQDLKVTYAQQVIKGSLRASKPNIYTTDVLNEQNGKYIGLYDILKELDINEDLRFNNYVVFKLGLPRNENPRNIKERDFIRTFGTFFQHWFYKMVLPNNSNAKHNAFFDKFLISTYMVNRAPDKDYYLQTITNLQHQAKELEEKELQRQEEAEAAKKVQNYTTKEYLDYLQGVRDLNLERNIVTFLDDETSSIDLTPETLANIKYISENTYTQTGVERYTLLKTLVRLVENNFIDRPSMSKVSFLTNKVYSTAQHRGLVSEKQWQYGGSNIKPLIQTFLTQQLKQLK